MPVGPIEARLGETRFAIRKHAAIGDGASPSRHNIWDDKQGTPKSAIIANRENGRIES